jgi:hypothetical protein
MNKVAIIVKLIYTKIKGIVRSLTKKMIVLVKIKINFLLKSLLKFTYFQNLYFNSCWNIKFIDKNKEFLIIQKI